MVENHRDRAEGWKYAKCSGHENERRLAELVKSDKEIQCRLMQTAHKEGRQIINIDYGGLSETSVCSVLGDSTKSKTDMHLHLDDSSCVNVSIKKSEAGQVYLISPDRFVCGFSMQYGVHIPDDVQRAIFLYWGTADDTLQIVDQYGVNKQYEKRKHRLVADTLKKYNINLANALIEWFNNNMLDIFDFCFSKGLARNQQDWADIVWYRNELHENNMDQMFNIANVKKLLPRNAQYGSRFGGTTIQLPFGFVQWHSPLKKIPGQIQFHHNFEKLVELVKTK